MDARASTPSTLSAIFQGLCPRCRMAPIFRGSMLWLTPMNQRCAVCDLQFEREPGYFLGAMYISYALAVPLMLGFLALFWWLTPWRWGYILLASALALLPFTPAVTLFARVLWIYLDRNVDPGE